jgi:hypothetical protein
MPNKVCMSQSNSWENDLSPQQRSKGWLTAVVSALLQDAFARTTGKSAWEVIPIIQTPSKADNECLEEFKGPPSTLGSCSPRHVRISSKQSQKSPSNFKRKKCPIALILYMSTSVDPTSWCTYPITITVLHHSFNNTHYLHLSNPLTSLNKNCVL